MFCLIFLINITLPIDISNTFSFKSVNLDNKSTVSFSQSPGDSSWTSNGPYGGVIQDLVVDSEFVYIGLLSNGVYRWPIDQVETWEPRRNGIQYSNILSLLSIAPDEVFVGLLKGGLRHTENGGVNWIKNTFIPDTTSVNVIFQYINDTLFVGTERSGLYRSTDGGFEWDRIGGVFGDTVNSRTFTRDSVNVYLGTDNGVFISHDLGNTWSSILGPNYYVNKLGWYNGFLYAGTKTRLLYRDKLNDWVYTNLTGEITDFSVMGDSLYVAVWGGGVASGCIGQTSFNYKNTGLINKAVNSIEIFDGIIYAGTCGGFFYSPDSAKNWYEENQDLNANIIWDIECNPINQKSVYTVSFGGLYKSDDNGNTWNRYGMIPDTSLFQSIVINPQDSSNIIIGSYNGIYRTIDNGLSWDFTLTGERSITDVEIDPTNPNRVYAAALDLFLSSNDNGLSWITSDSGKFYNDIEICYSAPETLYISTNNGMFKSDNFGANLYPINNGLPSDTVLQVGIDGYNPSLIYAGLKTSTTSYLYRSNDGGQNWDSTNYTGGTVTEVKTSRGFPFHSFVSSMDNNVFLTLNGGDDWIDIIPIDNNNLLCLDFSPMRHSVYSGNLSGVYSFTDTLKPFLDVSSPDSFSPDGDSMSDIIKFIITAEDSNQIYNWNGSIYHDTLQIKNYEGFWTVDSISWDGFNDSGNLEKNGTYEAWISVADGFLNSDTVIKNFILEKKTMISGDKWATTNSQGRNIALDNQGRIHVVYTSFKVGEVFYVNSQDGINWSEPVDLSNSKDEYSKNPCIAINENNTIYVFWEEEYADSHEIAYQCNDSGQWLDKSVILPMGPGESRNPNVVITPENDIHLVWEESDTNDIFYRRFNYSSETWSPSLNLSNTSGTSCDPFILAHNGIYVFFSDNSITGNFNIIKKYYDGSEWHPESLLVSTPGNSFSSFAVKDAFEQIHLFWSDSTPGNFDIYYKLYKSDSTWDIDTNLSQTDEPSNYPTISTDESGNVYLFWEEEKEIYRKVKDHHSGWLTAENISNTPTVNSKHPSSSFDCDLVWTEGDYTPYRIQYFEEKIPDETPPSFFIIAPDTCFINDSLFVQFSVDELLKEIPDMWLRDNVGDSIQFSVTEEQPLHYTGKAFIYGLEEGLGDLRISGTDLSNNTTDTTLAIWIVAKKFIVNAPDTCFINDSLFVQFSVNDSLNGLPDMWIRDNVSDSIQILVTEEQPQNYTGKAFIYGLEEGLGDLRISGTDFSNNTIDTTLAIWIVRKEFIVKAPDSCFINDSLWVQFSVNDSLKGLPDMWIRDNVSDSIQFLVTEERPQHYMGKAFIYGLEEGLGDLRISGIDFSNNTIDTTLAIWIVRKEFIVTAPDTCFIGDSLLVEFSVNSLLEETPNMCIRDNAGDSILLSVTEEQTLQYMGRAFIYGLEEGMGDLRISGTDLFNNTNDTTIAIWIATKGSLMPEDSCFAFPNPTKENYIKFMFYINQRARVTIEIFTLGGRKIDTFIDNNYGGGKIYEERISISDLGSDIYIFRATATARGEKEVITKKFGVIR
jgi:hypothetical protein